MLLTLRAHDEIGIEHFARRERDARASRDGRIRLDGANGCTEADSYAGCGVGELMKHRLVVPAMDVMVQRAVIKGHVQAPARVAHVHAHVVSPKTIPVGSTAWAHRAEAPAEQ